MKKHNQKVIGSLLVLVCLDITVRPKIILVVLNYETIKPSPTLLQVYVKTARSPCVGFFRVVQLPAHTASLN